MFGCARSHCVYILAVFSTLPTALIYSVSCHTSIFPQQSPQYSPGLPKRERERQTGISSTFANTACQSSSQTTQREPQCFRSQRSPHSTLLMWLITKLSLLSLVCLCVVTFLKFRQMFTLTAFLTPTGSVWRLATLTFFSQHLLQHRRKPLVHSSDLKDHRLLKLLPQSEHSSAASLTLPRTGQFNMRCLACKQNSFSFTLNPHGCPKGSPTAQHLLMERDSKPLRLLVQVAAIQVTQHLPCDQKVACLLPSSPAVHTSGCCCMTCERVLRMKWKRRHYSVAWFEWLNWQGNY